MLLGARLLAGPAQPFGEQVALVHVQGDGDFALFDADQLQAYAAPFFATTSRCPRSPSLRVCSAARSAAVIGCSARLGRFARWRELLALPDVRVRLYRQDRAPRWEAEAWLPVYTEGGEGPLWVRETVSLVTRDAHDLYRPYGFTPLRNPDGHMERHDPEVYRR